MAKSTILWTTQSYKLKQPVKDPVLGEIQIINVCPYKEVWIYAATFFSGKFTGQPTLKTKATFPRAMAHY